MLEGAYCKWILFLTKVISTESTSPLLYKYTGRAEREHFPSALLPDPNTWDIANVQHATLPCHTCHICLKLANRV